MTEGSIPNKRNILIAGAGPCGLVTAALLLQRDKGYHVTIVDASEDLGTVTDVALTKRSWTIGLSENGMEILKSVKGLYENYVKEIGTSIDCNSFFFGKKEFKIRDQDIPAKLKKLGVTVPRNYVADRNAIVAACSKFLSDRYGSSVYFKSHWNTKILYVDGENRRVLVRSVTSCNSDRTETNEKYISYDYLIGCDGIRSTVRCAMQCAHRDLLFDISDTFSCFKSVHIKCPTTIASNCIVILVESLPNTTMVGCPQPGGMMNLIIGHFKNKDVANDLMSNNSQVVAKYIKENLHAFAMLDYDDFAKQWVEQDWSTTGQIHCSVYHSEKISAIIMGDAAHATSPALSLGLNTAFGDASALNQLLNNHLDDWDKVLPEYSADRVKEGYALVELSFHLYALSPGLQLRFFLRDMLRDFWWHRFPTRIKPSAISQCMLGYKLSDVYKFATRTHRIQKARRSNHQIQHNHFLSSAGLL